jgi:hypothetical protein
VPARTRDGGRGRAVSQRTIVYAVGAVVVIVLLIVFATN